MKRFQRLTLYEYEKVEFDSPISNKTSVAINKIADELSVHARGIVFDKILNRKNETVGIKSFQYVGVIRVDDSLTIEILPKMYRKCIGEETDEKSININNLFFMMDYCGQLKLPHNHSSLLHSTKGDFIEILIYLFASELFDCIQNSTHHEYIAEEHNLSYLRGKLVLSKHITINSANKSRFYAKCDMFTPNNKLNIVLKYVTRMLLTISGNAKNKNLLMEIISIFDEVSDKKVTLSDTENIVLTRLNDRFDQSLKMAKLFLANKSLHLSVNEFESFTFLIDMNQLFEEFIATALKKSIRKKYFNNVIVKTQKPIKTLVDHTDKSNNGIFRMKPDITILRNDVIESIIDTKYKMLKEDRKLGVSQSDLYQMYAYANKYQTKNITLLYPKKPDCMIEPADFYIDESCTVKIRSIDLNYKFSKELVYKFEDDVFKLSVADLLNMDVMIKGVS